LLNQHQRAQCRFGGNAIAPTLDSTIKNKCGVFGCDTPVDELTASMGITSIQQAATCKQIGEHLPA